jgi:hypothetical protein
MELATTSRPDMMTGMASCWIGVGVLYYISLTAFNRGLIKRKSANYLATIGDFSELVLKCLLFS